MIPDNYKAFQDTLSLDEAPKGWPSGLRALWYDAKGDWESSHDIAQDMHNSLGSWIHDYLHRKEGDRFNAGYWYRQANKSFPKYTLDEELKVIVEHVLSVNKEG